MRRSYRKNLKKRVTTLFHKRTPQSILFNRLLILLNVAVFGIFLLEAIYPGHPAVRAIEIVFGVMFLFEYLARLWIAPRRFSFALNVFSVIDVLVVISLFAPLMTGNLALLRILRSLKILRTYYLVNLAKKESKLVARYSATLVSILNFLVFLGIMTAIVFVAEAQFNPYINSYLDALYFTVSTLTTTGYGDVIATGPWGKTLSVTAMLIGITLFLQLTRTIFRGAKIYYTCKECGLSAHDVDAIHCKHCGAPVKHRHFSHAI
ncbi:ion transporter [bacterium]|nr:ion transporter [bacterium]|tara:strand:+ start:2233 stop:3021 length:789 start_codon:yes stop_codon:yes gene_type:complete